MIPHRGGIALRRKSSLDVVCYFILKLLAVWPMQLIAWLIAKSVGSVFISSYSDFVDNDWENDSDNERELTDELNMYADFEELPDMCQIFEVDENTVIGVQFVSYCPDETVHIRVIGNDSFSPLYKRRVYYERRDRYFKLNGEKYFLNANTKATPPIQEKRKTK